MPFYADEDTVANSSRSFHQVAMAGERVDQRHGPPQLRAGQRGQRHLSDRTPSCVDDGKAPKRPVVGGPSQRL
jgi:hypothetical protein